MLRHIVWWTLKSHTNGQTSADNVAFINGASAELQSNPYASSLEVSAKVESSSTVPAQVVLLATFETADKLKAFENDPITQRFENMVKEKATSRNCLDYEVLPNLS